MKSNVTIISSCLCLLLSSTTQVTCATTLLNKIASKESNDLVREHENEYEYEYEQDNELNGIDIDGNGNIDANADVDYEDDSNFQTPFAPAGDWVQFAQSWSMGFCCNGHTYRQTAECNRSLKPVLGVHGLWPNYLNGGYPQFCDASKALGK